MSILERINGPSDIRPLSISELYQLAAEIRSLIISTVTNNGGHLASNLGVVELTLALHRVFSTPADSIVWDVGHQCYTHKILTGRRNEFARVRRQGGLSGFPKRSESVHDAFDAGHASTSISAALGILAANDVLDRRDAVVAVIGDGALTGGMAYEAMSHAGQLGLPLIIVLNDNAMSISRNVGAVSSYLSRLSATTRYQRIRSLLDRIILGVPLLGPRIHPFVLRLKRAVKAVFFKEGLFADLGFEYAGPIDGHNIELLSEVLGQARAIRKPVVVHVVTRKGKGHEPAEQNPAAYHGVPPAASTQQVLLSSDALDPATASAPKRVTFTEAFGAAMLEVAAADRRIVAVTAAMASGTGLSEFQRRYPRRLFDVGIAEEHAVTFAAGMATGGLRPVVAIYSTFMQRAVDQVHHDVALGDRPVIFAVDRAGAVPDDGETHQGLYDIQTYRSVPGLTILAPASAAEVGAALRWAVDHRGPTMIRYPKSMCPPERPAYAEPLEAGKGVFVRRSENGASVLFVSSGALVDEALRASDQCAAAGIGADVYHLRFIKPLDRGSFLERVRPYRLVIIVEEGVLTGSVASDLAAAVAQAAPDHGVRTVALALGFDERPLPQASRAELLAQAGLDASSLSRLAVDRMSGIERAASTSTARAIRSAGSGA